MARCVEQPATVTQRQQEADASDRDAGADLLEKEEQSTHRLQELLGALQSQARVTSTLVPMTMHHVGTDFSRRCITVTDNDAEAATLGHLAS